MRAVLLDCAWILHLRVPCARRPGGGACQLQSQMGLEGAEPSWHRACRGACPPSLGLIKPHSQSSLSSQPSRKRELAFPAVPGRFGPALLRSASPPDRPSTCVPPTILHHGFKWHVVHSTQLWAAHTRSGAHHQHHSLCSQRRRCDLWCCASEPPWTGCARALLVGCPSWAGTAPHELVVWCQHAHCRCLCRLWCRR